MNFRTFYLFLCLILSASRCFRPEQKRHTHPVFGRHQESEIRTGSRCTFLDINRHTGTTSNGQGIFSFIVTPSDSILFRSVGYKNTLVTIPDTIKTGHYPRDVYMLNDTIHLAEVKIFPWKTYEDFKVAFLNLDLPDQDMKNAVKNIELIKAQLNMDFEPDADLSFRNAMNQQYEKLYYNGQYPTIPILNPFNWAKFFQALKNGDFKKKEK